MSVAGTVAITELWAKCKAWFGRSLGSSTTASTASIQLKNNAGDSLGSAATIPAATTTAAGVMTADDKTKLNGIATGANNYVHPAFDAMTAKAKKVGNDAQGHVVLGDTLTASDVGAAASSHTHGSITNAGAITSDTAHASGDKLVIADSSDSSKLKRSDISLGTNDNTFLRKDGSWATPAGTTYSDFTPPTGSAAGTHGLVPAPAAGSGYDILTGDGWQPPEDAVMIGLDEWVSASGEQGYLYGDSDGVSIEPGNLMTDAEKTKLAGIEAGANNYTHPSYTSKTSGLYKITVDSLGHVSGTAAVAAGDLPTVTVAKGGTGATDASGARTNLDVYSKSEVDSLITGGATFQGIVNAQSTIEAASYKAGQYWVVGTAGTYVGQTCEVGDMIYAISTKGAAYSASDFSVVQNNLVEMTAAEVDAICV